MLSFHPKAEEHFNNLGDALIPFVEKHTERRKGETIDRTWCRPHLAATIQQSEIIGPVCFGRVDHSGTTVENYFQIGHDLFGLDNNHYQKLSRLAGKIHKCGDFHRSTTFDSIADSIFLWVELKYTGKSDEDLCKFLVEHLSKTIKDHEVWVPIASLSVQEEFMIGVVTFKQITQELLDAWQEKCLEGRLDQEKEIDLLFVKLRKKHQGYTAGMVHVTAEECRAREIAIEYVDKAVALLRFFSPASYTPEINCNCTPFGRHLIRTNTTWNVIDGSLGQSTSNALRSDMLQWFLGTEDIRLLEKHGLRKISSLHTVGEQSGFSATVANSLMLFSKVSLMKDLGDKLVYLFAAVESILLKNSGEPIQMTVSERMATILGGKAERKKEVIRNFKSMYGKRSDLVHHAKSVDLTDEMSVLMHNVWSTFHYIINEMHAFGSKSEFLDRVDDIKLGGS